MTAVAVVALALGIGANSAVFTFVNAVILRGVPFPDPDRVVALGTQDARNRRFGVSYYDFLDWREAARSFSDIVAHGPAAVQRQRAGHLARTLQRRVRLGEHVPADWRPGAASAADSSRKTISTAQRRSSSSGTASGNPVMPATAASWERRSRSTTCWRPSSA